ncbi:Rap guanine nucleotide exchange factor 3, partial [Lunasporangiospora selenospora]
METLKELEKLLDISNNMRYYRQAMAEAEAPTIPFLPILLKDITFILDGNQTMISSRANSSPASKQESQAPATGETTNGSLATPTVPVADGSTQSKEKESATNKEEKSSKSAENMLINFDKFRRLTQYVENAVDMAKSVDYWFEHKLLRQARVFRPLSPSMNNEVFGNDGESAH